MAVRQASRHYKGIGEFLDDYHETIKLRALEIPAGIVDGALAPEFKLDLVLPIVGRLGPIPAQVVSRAPDGSVGAKLVEIPFEVQQGFDQLFSMVDEVRRYLLGTGDVVSREVMESAVYQAASAAHQAAEGELTELRQRLAQQPAVQPGQAPAPVVQAQAPGERGFPVPDLSGMEPALEGVLGDRTLRDAMVKLAIERATGLMVVVGDDGTRRFGFWQRGGPVGWRVDPVDQRSVLGVLLFRAGRVDREQLQRSLQIMEDQNIRQGEALIQQGVINFPQLVMALQKQVELHLQKVMRLSSGAWAFFALADLPERFITPPLQVPSILFRALLAYTKELSSERLGAAHRPNMDRYVFFAPGVAETVAEINFKSHERKFLEIMGSNSWRLRELFSVSNLSRTDTSAMAWALNEMGFMDYRQEETRSRFIQRVTHRIKQKVSQVRAGSHFDILEIHWICLPDEVREGYERLQREFGDQAYRDLPPELMASLAEIMKAVEEAHEFLSDDKRRRAYRAEKIESDMIDASAELLGKKGELHIMKGDRIEAVTCWGKAAELRPNIGMYRDGLSRAKSL